MELTKVLEVLTNPNIKKESSNEECFLQTIIKKADSLLSDEFRNEIKSINPENSLIKQYLYIILFILRELEKMDLGTEENMLSVSQYQTIKKSIGFATSIGIISCLIPGIGMENSQVSESRIIELSQETLSIMQKYERLCDTSKIFSNCFFNLCLRPVLLPYLGSLYAALLQLSFAPLMKPKTEDSLKNSKADDFKMTNELYLKLKSEQLEFQSILRKLIDACPQCEVMKEFMILHGAKKSPKWLRENVRNFLAEAIVQPYGVISLIQAICEDTEDSGNWQKLDIVAKLISVTHGNNPEEYYKSICSQLLEILMAKNLKYGTTIANSCMAALYEVNPEICRRKIFHVLAEPFLIKPNNREEILKSEEEVSKSIEILSKCFLSSEAEFKTLPIKLIFEIALPLFHLHLKASKSVSHCRTKIRQLLLKILENETTRETIFSLFLEHEISNIPMNENFGNKLSFEFGSTGGFQITGKEFIPNHEDIANSLFDLVQSNEILANSLFNYLLKFLATFQRTTNTNLLETDTDLMERVTKQLSTVQLISNLANTKTIQEAQIKRPKPLLSFIESICNETKSESKEDDSFDMLYTGLMLVKIILTDRGKPQDWQPFDEFSQFLEGVKKSNKISEHAKSLMNEIINIIKLRSSSQKFYDMSVDPNRESEFDKALKDLTDPMLPVRGHGIIALTKLIENSDSEAVAKKDVILYLFQENLKHEDSFIYLATVNGVCSLAIHFPQKVLEILVQEFIDMPQRTTTGEIAPETRAKLGEILVKTTRALGDMAPAYKTLLVNAFLCGTRDPDPLVRSSSLSCLGELCKVLGFKIGNLITEILYCIGCIIKTDKDHQCRRAGVMVATLLLRGLGKDMLTSLGNDLVILYRGLIHLRDNDDDSVLRLHAQLALEEFDDVVQNVLFAKPKLEKSIFLLR